MGLCPMGVTHHTVLEHRAGLQCEGTGLLHLDYPESMFLCGQYTVACAVKIEMGGC